MKRLGSYRARGRSVLAGLAGLLLLGSAAPAGAQFSASPVVVQFSPGDASPARIEIRNEGENALGFRSYALDFDMSADGEHSFWEHGSRESSCGSRLAIAPDAFTVPAGGTGTVSVSLEPGAVPDQTCWSMVLVETSGGAGSGSIVVNRRIGVKVYGLSENGRLDAELLGGTADRLPGAVAVEFTVRNHGAWPLRPKGVVEVRDVMGGVVSSRRIDAFSVLPGRDRTVSVRVPVDEGLVGGRYLAVPILDFGADYLAGTQIDFRIGS